MIRDPLYVITAYGAGGLVLIGAVAVVTVRNLLRAALAASFTFAMVAVTYLLLSAEFLFFMQLMVYAGAVSALFIAAIRFTRSGSRLTAPRALRQYVAAAIAALSFALLALVLGGAGWVGGAWTGQSGTALELGRQLVTTYAVPLETAAVLLLTALVGAAALGPREEPEVRAAAAPRRQKRRSAAPGE